MRGVCERGVRGGGVCVCVWGCVGVGAGMCGYFNWRGVCGYACKCGCMWICACLGAYA